MTEEIIITEKYFDNKDDNFQDFTYYTVREGMDIYLYDAIQKQNEYVQRLKQENEELGKIIDSKNGTIATLANTRDNLKQENEKLKEEKLYRGIDRQFIEDANDKLFYQAEKYRKALEEIRDKIQLGKITSYYDYEYINKRIDEVLGNE